MKTKELKTKSAALMLVIRCNLDDFAVAIGRAAYDDFHALKKLTGDKWAEACLKHVKRIRLTPGKTEKSMSWPTWDESGLVNCSLFIWTDDRHCRLVDDYDGEKKRKTKVKAR